MRSYNGMVEVLTKTQDILIVVLGNDEENELDCKCVAQGSIFRVIPILIFQGRGGKGK